MLELGDDSSKYHAEIGAFAKKARIDKMLGYGKLSKFAAGAFGSGAEHFDDKQELYARLKEIIREDDLVLFKASRGMALEEVAFKLMETQ